MALDEVFQTQRDLAVLFGVPFCELVGEVIRHIARPTLRGIEGDHSDGIGILACHEVRDDDSRGRCDLRPSLATRGRAVLRIRPARDRYRGHLDPALSKAS